MRRRALLLILATLAVLTAGAVVNLSRPDTSEGVLAGDDLVTSTAPAPTLATAPSSTVDLEAFAAAMVEAQRATTTTTRAPRPASTSTTARSSRSTTSAIPDGYWDRMAQCETGGNWSMVGATYSGGLGFYNGTWDQWGGREFADRAGRATRAQQIVVANRVASDVGLSGWGCLRVVGYP